MNSVSHSLARYQLVHRNESVYHDLTWLLSSRERIRPREEGLELLEEDQFSGVKSLPFALQQVFGQFLQNC